MTFSSERINREKANLRINCVLCDTIVVEINWKRDLTVARDFGDFVVESFPLRVYSSSMNTKGRCAEEKGLSSSASIHQVFYIGLIVEDRQSEFVSMRNLFCVPSHSSRWGTIHGNEGMPRLTHYGNLRLLVLAIFHKKMVYALLNVKINSYELSTSRTLPDVYAITTGCRKNFELSEKLCRIFRHCGIEKCKYIQQACSRKSLILQFFNIIKDI